MSSLRGYPHVNLPAIQGSQNLHLTYFCIPRQTPKSQEICLNLVFYKQCLPEDDVAVRGDLFPPVDSACPVSPWPDTKHGFALIREGLEVPLLRFKHVLHAICAHGHHHLRAGLGTRD